MVCCIFLCARAGVTQCVVETHASISVSDVNVAHNTRAGRRHFLYLKTSNSELCRYDRNESRTWERGPPRMGTRICNLEFRNKQPAPISDGVQYGIRTTFRTIDTVPITSSVEIWSFKHEKVVSSTHCVHSISYNIFPIRVCVRDTILRSACLVFYFFFTSPSHSFPWRCRRLNEKHIENTHTYAADGKYDKPIMCVRAQFARSCCRSPLSVPVAHIESVSDWKRRRKTRSPISNKFNWFELGPATPPLAPPPPTSSQWQQQSV